MAMEWNEASLAELAKADRRRLSEQQGLLGPKEADLVEEPLNRWGKVISTVRKARGAREEMTREHAVFTSMMLEHQLQLMQSQAANGSLFRRFKTAFENRADWYEPGAARRSSFGETTGAGDIATFTQQILAFLLPVFERIMIDRLVTVRAMNGPTAFVHTLSYTQANAGEYAAGTAFNGRLDVDYSDCPTECGAANGVNMRLTSVTVTALCKRLQAQWSLNAQQDLMSQYGMSLGTDVRGMMQLQILRERQGEVLAELIAGAGYAGIWASNIPVGSVYNTLDPKVYQATLYDAIIDADNAIYTSNDGYRAANWIAGDPVALTILQKLKKFAITQYDRVPRDQASTGDVDEFSNFFGVANHQYNLYKFPFMTASTLLLGVKSDAPQEQGFIHAEYLPMTDLGIFLDPATACYRTGVQSRYVNVMLRPGLYATVTIV